ncbi:unnamed protein product [Echinostoma caproni]|uniref:Signal recognition particle-docking protein FtsY n=1 Tax=Echinostoma caproni TaxID=27848 RepID=A0A183B9S1_9TREM|nr:unnamed protein product [Echinostoma caproni]
MLDFLHRFLAENPTSKATDTEQIVADEVSEPADEVERTEPIVVLNEPEDVNGTSESDEAVRPTETDTEQIIADEVSEPADEVERTEPIVVSLRCAYVFTYARR